MALKEFKEIVEDLKQFIIDNPGVSCTDLMTVFGWTQKWRHDANLRPLKKGHGINGEDIFLFVSKIRRAPYYYERGFAIKNNIPETISLKLSDNDRKKRHRKADAESKIFADNFEANQRKSLISNVRLSHMMKPTKSI